MSRNGSLSKEAPEQSYSINQEAFNFLARCPGLDFDMTSAEPPHPKHSQILPPTKVLKLLKGEDFDFDDLTEVHGTSRGEETSLQRCVDFFNRHRIPCAKENISLSDSILSALSLVYSAIGLSETRKILVPTPTFGYYFKQFKEKNIAFETLPTEEDGFLPDPVKLEEAIVRTGAVALLLCYPNNPTGAIMTSDCAHAIADVVTRHNVFVISDEAFMNNSLSEKQHFPIAAVPGMLEKSFSITSPAKSVFVGIKTGFCVGRQDIVSSFEKLGGYPTKRTQKITTIAIEDSLENREYLEKCRDYYLNNIAVIQNKSHELNQKFCEQFDENKIYAKPYIERPDATNIYLMDFSGLRGKKHKEKIMNTGLDVAKWLLEEASVGTVPGECFLFNEEKMLVRIALNRPAHEITLAFDNIIAATTSIQNSVPSRSPSPSNIAGKVFDPTKSSESKLM